MTSRTRQRWLAGGLLVAGLAVGGALGAVAGNAGSEEAAPAPTTSSTTTTTVPSSLRVTYPTAGPTVTPLPVINRDGSGPDPLLAVGLGTEEVVVRVTEEGLELLPVDAPGQVMGLGHAAAGYHDGSWVYLAPLDGSPVRRLPVVGRPGNDGATLSWVSSGPGGPALARVDLDDPALDVTVDPALPDDLPIGADTRVAATDPDGVVLHLGSADAASFVLVDRAANVLELPDAGFSSLAPGAVAVVPRGGDPVWLSRETGARVEGPATIEGCAWPNQFQGGTSLWWCDDGIWADRPGEWNLQDSGGAQVALFDDGRTIVRVLTAGIITVVRPGEDADPVVISFFDALVSAVRP